MRLKRGYIRPVRSTKEHRSVNVGVLAFDPARAVGVVAADAMRGRLRIVTRRTHQPLETGEMRWR